MTSSDKYLKQARAEEAARLALRSKSKKKKRRHKGKKKSAKSESDEEEDDIPVLHTVSTAFDKPEASILDIQGRFTSLTGHVIIMKTPIWNLVIQHLTVEGTKMY